MIERQTKRQEIYQGKVIHVVVDDVELEDGSTSKREVVLHHGGACIALQAEDGKFFMVKQYRYSIGKEMLEFCAGKIEEGEDPKETVLRECREELGYEAEGLVELGSIIPTCGYCSERIHLYYAKKGKRVGQHFDADEDLHLYKYTYDEIQEMIDNNVIDDAKTIVLMYRIGMRGLHE